MHGNGRPRYALMEVDTGYDTPCWGWPGAVDRQGYARTHRRGKYGGHQFVHRIYFEDAYGPVPEGYTLDHLCRVPSCANPDHLEVVSNTENIRRGRAAKLDPERARKIRNLRGEGFTYVELGRMFGVGATCIEKVVKRINWKDVK